MIANVVRGGECAGATRGPSNLAGMTTDPPRMLAAFIFGLAVGDMIIVASREKLPNPSAEPLERWPTMKPIVSRLRLDTPQELEARFPVAGQRYGRRRISRLKWPRIGSRGSHHAHLYRSD